LALRRPWIAALVEQLMPDEQGHTQGATHSAGHDPAADYHRGGRIVVVGGNASNGRHR